MRIEGRVSSGLGRAHVFMAQAHYQDQFKEILGATAWPGTLNLQVSGDDLAAFCALRWAAGLPVAAEVPDGVQAQADGLDLSGVRTLPIRGFDRDGRSFGGATAFRASLPGLTGPVECAVLIPDLTRHVDVMEVIAAVFLREALDLQDGDPLPITLEHA